MLGTNTGAPGCSLFSWLQPWGVSGRESDHIARDVAREGEIQVSLSLQLAVSLAVGSACVFLGASGLPAHCWGLQGGEGKLGDHISLCLPLSFS